MVSHFNHDGERSAPTRRSARLLALQQLQQSQATSRLNMKISPSLLTKRSIVDESNLFENNNENEAEEEGKEKRKKTKRLSSRRGKSYNRNLTSNIPLETTDSLRGSSSTRSKSTKTKTTKAKTKVSTKRNIHSSDNDYGSDCNIECLPRTRENELKSTIHNSIQVIGVDEAGRGPLAGPVVAAAAIIPQNIHGVTDSKKLTKEEDREKLYEKIISCPNAKYAIAIVDAKRIDEINILQATLQAMSMATTLLISPESYLKNEIFGGMIQSSASSNILGCYAVCTHNDSHGKPITYNDTSKEQNEYEVNSKEVNHTKDDNNDNFYAIIDGNKAPKDFPCDCESMVKGDSKEYSIGAASIVAKVTRDRLMREYDVKYPEYELYRHKGYPTAAHMAKVREFGASPIHRRSFAPLKHMTFDEHGKIV